MDPSGGRRRSYRLSPRSRSDAGAANIGTFSSGTTPGLGVPDVPDGTYFVRVRALRNDVVGPPSNEVQVIVAACPLPAAPGGLRRVGSGNTVMLTWTAAAGASSYVVEAGSSQGAANLASINTGGAISLTTGAPNGVYYVRVRGLNGCGLSPPTSELMVMVP